MPARLPPPLVSIVTVALNGAGTIERAIESVLRLRDERIEYLVFDGGSTDGTVEILRKHDHDIDYWRSQPDLGIYDAMNSAWELSSGAFIYFLGCDDELLSIPVSSLQTAIDRDIPIVYGDVRLRSGRRFHSVYGSRLKLDNTLHHQGLFIRRAICPEKPFDERFPLFADFDLNQRLYRRNCKALAAGTEIAIAEDSGRSSRGDRRELHRIIKSNFGLPTLALAIVVGKYRSLQRRLRAS